MQQGGPFFARIQNRSTFLFPTYRTLLFLTFLLPLHIPKTTLSQHSHFGIGFSAGGTTPLDFSRQGILATPPVASVASPISMGRQDHSGGMEYRWIPSSSSLGLEKAIGLEYSYKEYYINGDLELHSIRIPLMLGFHWGEQKKGWNVVPAIGIQTTIPIEHSTSDEEVQKVYSYSFGYKMRVDLRYNTGSPFTFLLAYETQVGLTPVYEKFHYMAKGRPGLTTDPQYDLEGYLNFSLLYRLSSLLNEGSEQGKD